MDKNMNINIALLGKKETKSQGVIIWKDKQAILTELAAAGVNTLE